MKARPFSGNHAKASLLILLLIMTGAALRGQELTQLISSKLEVVDEQDRQMSDCSTYRFGNKTLYDNANALRLYEDGAYRFDLNFTYFPDQGGIITPRNYLGKFYSLRIPDSPAGNYRITAISPASDKLNIYAIATGGAGIKDTFHIQLLDDKARLLAEVAYPFEIHRYDPSSTTTIFMPMKMEFKPLYLTLEDADNPGNRIERQILPFSPDTINVDAGKGFKLLAEIEEQVYINDQAYVLVADHERDYGYRISAHWEGPALRYKSDSENGLKADLAMVSDNTSPPQGQIDIAAILTEDLQKAGLDKKGSRVQQTIELVSPIVDMQKVYNAQYLQEHPGVSRTRTDQKALQFILQKNLPKAQLELRNAEQMMIKDKNPVTQPQARVQSPQVYQEQSTMMKTRPQNEPTAKKMSPAQSQKAKVMQPQQDISMAPRYEKAPPVKPDHSKKRLYYTLSIELSRETDVMSHQTYLVTFRLVE